MIPRQERFGLATHIELLPMERNYEFSAFQTVNVAGHRIEPGYGRRVPVNELSRTCRVQTVAFAGYIASPRRYLHTSQWDKLKGASVGMDDRSTCSEYWLLSSPSRSCVVLDGKDSIKARESSVLYPDLNVRQRQFKHMLIADDPKKSYAYLTIVIVVACFL